MSRSSARLLADLLDSTGDVKLENLDNIEDAVNGTAKRQSFTATAGQTTFNVAGGFDSGYVDVYMDGVKLHTSDFADTSGTAIVLALGASENQLIDVIAYGTFTLSNLGIPDINTLQTVLDGKQASGSYETADATILKDADIGVNVQAYDSTIVVDADIGTTVLAPDGDGSQLTNLPAGGATDIDGLSDGVTYSSGSSIGLGSGALANDGGTDNKNTATGFEALKECTTGWGNSFVGWGAGKGVWSGSTGSGNTGMGIKVLNAVSTGWDNVAIGKTVMYLATTGYYNTGVGAAALQRVTTGINNTMIGRGSGEYITTGSNNVILGSYGGTATLSDTVAIYAGSTERLKIDSTGMTVNGAAVGGASDIDGLSDAKTTATSNIGLGTGAVTSISWGGGDYNVGVGDYALNAVNSGNENTAVGYSALKVFTNSENTAVGFESMTATTTGGQNTAIGHASMQTNTTGEQSAATGVNCLKMNTTGSGNVASGYHSMYSNTTGGNNTATGVYSLLWNTTGNNNICIGSKTGWASSPSGSITTGSNIICLGDNSISNFYCADTSISSSDKRDKADIEDFNTGLDFINKMRPVTYRWDKRSWYLDDEDTDVLSVTRDGSLKKQKQHIGFIAQEVEELEQEIGFATSKDNQLMCNTNEDDTAMGIKYERIVPVLVNAIKELSANNTSLLARIEALENA